MPSQPVISDILKVRVLLTGQLSVSFQIEVNPIKAGPSFLATRKDGPALFRVQ